MCIFTERQRERERKKKLFSSFQSTKYDVHKKMNFPLWTIFHFFQQINFLSLPERLEVADALVKSLCGVVAWRNNAVQEQSILRHKTQDSLSLHFIEKPSIIDRSLDGSRDESARSTLNLKPGDSNGVGEVLAVRGLEDTGGSGDEDRLSGFFHSGFGGSLWTDFSTLIVTTKSWEMLEKTWGFFV